MAEPIAQFENTEPVFQPTKIIGKEKGAEAFSKVFGEASTAEFKRATSQAKESSQAMLMNGAAQANSVVADAKIKMAQNPGQAEEISKGMEKSLNQITQTPLNAGDRSKLNYLLSNSKNTLKMQAAGISVNQNRKENSLNFMGALPAALSEYQKALLVGDEKSALTMSNTTLENAKNLVKDGSLPIGAYENLIKTIHGLHERAVQVHQLVGDPKASAAKLQSASIDVFSTSSTDTSKLTPNHGTQMMSNHFGDAATVNDTNASIDNLTLSQEPDLLNYMMGSSPAQFAQFIQRLAGSTKAHGMINANTPFNQIQQRIDELDVKTDISSQEKSELNVLKNHVSDFTSRGYWETLSKTTLGAQAVHIWNSTKDSIGSYVGYGMSPENEAANREFQQRANDNNFMRQGVSIAEASHMPAKSVKPIIPEIMQPLQSAFNLDGDPTQAYDAVKRLSKDLVGYAGRQMKTGIQREVVTAIGFGAGNNMSPSFSLKLIAANKDNQDFSALNTKGEEASKTSDSLNRALIYANSGNELSYLKAAGGDEAVRRNTDFINSGLNYIKYRALESGDLDMSHADKYIQEFKQEMGHAYNIGKVSGMQINLNQVNISTGQQEVLRNYVINEARAHYSGNATGDLNFQADFLKTDINVYLDSTNHMVATDQNGNSLFYALYTPQLMSAAEHQHAKNKSDFKKIKVEKDLDVWYGGFQ